MTDIDDTITQSLTTPKYIMNFTLPVELNKKMMSNEDVRLKRRMGLFSAVNVILAVMIGSGIFVSPSSALKYSGSVGMAIVVWTSCGIVSCLGKTK